MDANAQSTEHRPTARARDGGLRSETASSCPVPSSHWDGMGVTPKSPDPRFLYSCETRRSGSGGGGSVGGFSSVRCSSVQLHGMG